MTAPAYSARRSALAKQLGLGTALRTVDRDDTGRRDRLQQLGEINWGLGSYKELSPIQRPGAPHSCEKCGLASSAAVRTRRNQPPLANCPRRDRLRPGRSSPYRRMPRSTRRAGAHRPRSSPAADGRSPAATGRHRRSTDSGRDTGQCRPPPGTRAPPGSRAPVTQPPPDPVCVRASPASARFDINRAAPFHRAVRGHGPGAGRASAAMARAACPVPGRRTIARRPVPRGRRRHRARARSGRAAQAPRT